jgi:ferredoxin
MKVSKSLTISLALYLSVVSTAFQQPLFGQTRHSLLLHSTKQIDASTVVVDMNVYNLQSLEEIAQQWTANLLPANDLQDAGVYLGAKNSENVFVDTLKVVVKRGSSSGGLGIQLLEIAGGREDGLGITIVSGLVEGGASENSGLMEGDSLSQVSVRAGNDEIAAVDTECLGYDKTVEAIGSLPPPASEDEQVILTVKRLRRKPKVSVTFQYPPDMGEKDIKIELFSGENLRRAMLVRGVKLNDPLARRFDNGGSGDCGAEGTCATCAVSIVRGDDLLSPAGQTESQIFKNNPRWRLACKAIVGYGMKEGEMIVRVNPRQWG